MAANAQITDEADAMLGAYDELFAPAGWSWIVAFVRGDAPANVGCNNVDGLMAFPSLYISACGKIGRFHYKTVAFADGVRDLIQTAPSAAGGPVPVVTVPMVEQLVATMTLGHGIHDVRNNVATLEFRKNLALVRWPCCTTS